MQIEILYRCSECGIHIWPDDIELTRGWFSEGFMYICPECDQYCEWEEVEEDVETAEMYTDFDAD